MTIRIDFETGYFAVCADGVPVALCKTYKLAEGLTRD